MGQNTSKVTTQKTTFTLCYIPGASVREIPVAMALKLMPSITACLCVCRKKCKNNAQVGPKELNYSINYYEFKCI